MWINADAPWKAAILVVLVLCDSRCLQQWGLTNSEGSRVRAPNYQLYGQLCFKLSLSTSGNTIKKNLSASASRGQCTHKSPLQFIRLPLVSLASVLEFLDWFMFRISSTDRTGNWLGGTVVKGVLSKSSALKYLLP